MADLKNDIDKYRKGELSPAEMHALERRALNDPFLADALEGAAEIPSPEFDADLHDLQNALQQRIGRKEERKVVSLWVWSARIAAGLAIIAVASLIIFQLTDRKKNEALSMIPDKEMVPALPKDEPAPTPNEQKTVPLQAPPVQETPNSIVQGADEKPVPLASEAPSFDAFNDDEKPVEPKVSSPLARSEPATQAVVTSPEKADQSILKEQAEEAVVQSKRKKIGAAQSAVDLSSTNGFSYNNINQQPVADSTAFIFKPTPGIVAGVGASKPKMVTGRVTDIDGEGLPGVNVMIKGSNVGTVTDATGDYQIALQENDKLLFTYIGYTGQEADAKKDKVDIQMDVDAAQLSEVVVVGYEPAFEKDEERAEALELASPEGGRRAFKQYLEKNLLYPQQAIEHNVEGRVTIQFTVESTGLLSDFSVLKGIGFGCDDEVIRLVRQGPKWFPTKRSNEAVRDRVKVRMKFVLPKK
jgi:TonB family protein